MHAAGQPPGTPHLTPVSNSSPTQPLPALSTCSVRQLSATAALSHVTHSSGYPTPQVQCALSRRRKEETVETLTKQLESSALVFGVRFQNISVPFSIHLRFSASYLSYLRVTGPTYLIIDPFTGHLINSR